MIQSHKLRSREFVGQFEAEKLVLWLQVNEHRKRKGLVTAKDRTPEFKRVSNLLALLQTAEKARGKQPTPDSFARLARIPIMKMINSRLFRYRCRLRIDESFETRWVEVKAPAVYPSEGQAIMYMVRLSELG